MRRLIVTIMAALLGMLALTGTVGAAPPPLPGMDKMMAAMEQDTITLRGLSGKDFEIAYLQKMRLHHMMAVEMAKLVPGKAVHPELTKLAQSIITDQQQEIGQLEGWLKAWYGIDKPADMPMAGMDEMMATMMTMTSANLEQAFLMMMVHHHQGAIDMSALAPGRATHPELRTFASTVITAQTKEQTQMRGWAMVWYGFDPLPMSHGGMPMPGLPNTGAGGGAQQPHSAVALLAALSLALLVGGVARRRLAR